MDLLKLVNDWGGFEKLVVTLNETGGVTVEHNVTLKGRSGAPRQIDVLIRHKVGLIEHLVVVECKYWKSSVKRAQVDAMATTIKEVGASRGVIFTSKGYQSGAIQEAKFQNIDIFKVRTLKDEEWGLPGQIVDIFLHTNSIAIGPMQFNNPFIILGKAPSSTNFEIDLGGPDSTPSQTPIKWEGKPFTTFEEMMSHIAIEAAKQKLIPGPIKVGDGHEGQIRFRFNVVIAPKTPIEVFANDGIIFIPHISFSIGVTVDQTRLQIDRAQNQIFGLAIENCINKTVTAASRRKGDETTTLKPLEVENASSEEILQNGSLLTIWLKGNHQFDEFDQMETDRVYINGQPMSPGASATSL